VLAVAGRLVQVPETFFCHWYAGAGFPVAVTLKVAVAPADTV
jgi:hypothetical protein